LSLLDAVQYDAIFAFQYSPRPNTAARGMPDAVPEEEKGRRLARVLDRQREIQLARNETLIGQTFEVLVDGESRRAGQWSGRCSRNRVLNFTSPRNELLGKYVQVRVDRAGPNSLVGEHVEQA
jgi:tRNA-2-methylthio-N6-dimethylallyladenosine synthase